MLTRIPPLPVWGLVLALITGLIALTHGTGERYRSERATAFQQYQQERLRTYLSGTGQAPRVVTLGNSLLRAATPFEALPDAQQTRWLRIFRPSDDFEPFARLWPVLLENPPEVLIVHTGLLLPEPPERLRSRSRAAHILNDLHDWKKVRKTWQESREARRQRYTQEVADGQAMARCLFYSDWDDARDFMAPDQPRYRQQPPVHDGAAALLRQAAARIPKVILLDVPRSQSAEAAFGAEAAQWRQAVQDAFRDTPNIRLLRLGEPQPDDCYCDYRHLKVECRSHLLPAYEALAREIRTP